MSTLLITIQLVAVACIANAAANFADCWDRRAERRERRREQRAKN